MYIICMYIYIYIYTDYVYSMYVYIYIIDTFIYLSLYMHDDLSTKHGDFSWDLVSRSSIPVECGAQP